MLIARVLLRRPWLGYLPLYTLLAVINVAVGPPVTGWIVAFVSTTLYILVLTRYGLFACLVATAFELWVNFPLTVDPSSWSSRDRS